MSRLQVSFACAPYDRMVSLLTGAVRPAGIDLNFISIPEPRETFDRMAGANEFDSAEFSVSEFVSRISAGKCPFVAIPIFPSRMFRHGFIIVNTKKIREPKDLEGKRVGVPLYTMTAAVWIRGILQHEYGVDLSTVTWVQGSINKAGSHGSPTVMPLLKQVTIEANRGNRSLSDLLDAGEIDAVIGTGFPEAMERNPDIKRLFPNYPDVERAYYRKTGIYPIMHLVAIKRDLYERQPFVATSLYKALAQSKDVALAQMRRPAMLATMMPWMLAEIDVMNRVFGADPWPYGIEPNRKTLEALVQYLAEQSLIAKPIPVDDLFVDVVS